MRVYAEGARTGDIVDHNGHARVTDVRWDEAAESLLSSCIPELQSYGTVLEVHCLWLVLISCRAVASPGLGCHTLDRKSMPIVAWYMLSNESYMNLVMSDVFPTVPFC